MSRGTDERSLICGFEGTFMYISIESVFNARVAQWWSIALPRRGSRVRIPSRAFKEIEKRVIRWMALFSMFKPCRARTVRMSPLRSGRRSRTSPGRSATSRALKEIQRKTSDGWLFFLCSSPAGFERFECLRSTPVVATISNACKS